VDNLARGYIRIGGILLFDLLWRNLEQSIRWLSFQDVINLTLYTAPGSLFLTAWIIMAFLSVRASLATQTQLKSYKWALVGAYIFVAVHIVLMLLFIYFGLMRLGYEEFKIIQLRVPPLAYLLSFIAGLVISATMSIYQIRRSPELLLVVLGPIILLPTISFLASRDARRAYECKRPVTTTYIEAESQEPTCHQVCEIMLLDRGVLSFEKETKAIILIPWSVLTEPLQYGTQYTCTK
jgi:hypothetical protein